jgi:hypothetical protein
VGDGERGRERRLVERLKKMVMMNCSVKRRRACEEYGHGVQEE